MTVLKNDRFLRALLREPVDRTPLWMMRQAGRYLPEYRELRAEKGGFLELVYDSEAAAEITVQPIRRFAFDGAILFSDILIVPHAMGQGLEFLAGEGPKMSPTLREVEL
ncbi:MAG: uroporphyrinogen decarboxylase family protein, partial [Pseudomonadota bacterium]